MLCAILCSLILACRVNIFFDFLKPALKLPFSLFIKTSEDSDDKHSKNKSDSAGKPLCFCVTHALIFFIHEHQPLYTVQCKLHALVSRVQ